MLKMIVDLGCGTIKFSGAIGIHRIPHLGVNIVCELEYSIPYRSNSIETLHTSHTLEHINKLIPLKEEIYRVCKPGALYITVPYFTYEGAFRDPTHVRFFSEETFSCFQDPTPYGIKTDFRIQDISYKYRTIFRIFLSSFKRFSEDICGMSLMKLRFLWEFRKTYLRVDLFPNHLL